MAITEHASGSQTATISTEHTLNGASPETTAGVFQVVVDLANLANGDSVHVRIYEKCRSGDAQRLLMEATHSNALSSPLWMSPSMILLHGWDVTLEQTTGTGRAFPWSIRKVA